MSRAVPVAILLLGAQSATAQVEAVRPTYSVPAPPDIGSIHARYAGAAKVAAWYANTFGDIKLAERVADIHVAATGNASSLIDWTGQGVLYELRVLRRTEPNAVGLYDAYIEGDSAVLIAAGVSPEEALFRQPSMLRPGASPGYSYDPLYSHYFFVTRSNGTLESSVVPRGTALDLHQAVMNNYGDLQLKYGLSARSTGERYAAIASAARSRISSSDLLLRLNRSEKVLQDSRATVARIDQQLRDASDKAEKAAREAKMLGVLSTIVSAAELASRANANINDPTLDLQGANTPEVVIERVRTYEDAQVRIRESLRIEYSNGLDGYKKALNEFRESIAPATPPLEVRRSLEVPEPR